jgi:2-polyprenyl-6-hydroxyphenyl methylase/3-demethylubiquinone-9 3-methyltransferase
VTPRVDNAVYARLGDRWYDAQDDPIALLRAEARLRNPWIARRIEAAFPGGGRVLDVGCGAGFLANDLAARGHRVTGVDAAREALEVAARRDRTSSVTYVAGDALALPFESGTFDAACAMDLLEHVEQPFRVVGEIARVLRPSGLFFFHTFNRNALSWLVVIKGVEWFVRNTPRGMHVLRLFLKPEEMRAMCAACGLEVLEMLGSRPPFDAALLEMLASGVVPPRLQLVFTSSLTLGYTGVARRAAPLTSTG